MNERLTIETFSEALRGDLTDQTENDANKRKQAEREAQKALKRKELQDRFKKLSTPFSVYMNPPE